MPAAVDAWLTALSRYGTLRLAEVAAPAIELALGGFPMYRAMRHDLALMDQLWFDQLPTCRAHFLPNGHLPGEGERFAQPAVGRTLQRLVEAESAAQSNGRPPGSRRRATASTQATSPRRSLASMRRKGGCSLARTWPSSRWPSSHR